MVLSVSPRLTRYRPVARLFFAAVVFPADVDPDDPEGTLRYFPATSRVRALIPLSRASVPIVVPYRAAIPLKVSPRFTLCRTVFVDEDFWNRGAGFASTDIRGEFAAIKCRQIRNNVKAGSRLNLFIFNPLKLLMVVCDSL